MDKELIVIVAQAVKYLVDNKLMLATAESCTGGMAAEMLTSIAGSSQYFERGFVAYSNEAKQEMLGVNAQTIEKFGAVSEETAYEMAEGALKHSKAQITLAITGIAGPGGGAENKPIGTVCFAWAKTGSKTIVKTEHFSGDRKEIRQKAVCFALSNLNVI